jgi:transcription antitermination factor NusG
MAGFVTEMAELHPVPADSVRLPDRAVEDSTLRWYLASTRSRHEKVVHEQLLNQQIEHFLPLYESVRRWHDRDKRVSLPIFPGYVFVRIPPGKRMRVLQTPGVTRFVTFGNQPAVLHDIDVDSLRTALTSRRSEPHPYLATGDRVRVASGPLRGLCGVIQRERRARLIVSIDCVYRSVAVELDESDLRPE